MGGSNCTADLLDIGACGNLPSPGRGLVNASVTVSARDMVSLGMACVQVNGGGEFYHMVSLACRAAEISILRGLT